MAGFFKVLVDYLKENKINVTTTPYQAAIDWVTSLQIESNSSGLNSSELLLRLYKYFGKFQIVF